MNAGVVIVCVAVYLNPVWAQQGADEQMRRRADRLSKRADSLRQEYEVGAAVRTYRRALAGYRRLGDLSGQGHVRKEIGILHAIQDRHDHALSNMEASVQFYRAEGDSASVAKGLNNIAIINRRTGSYEEALEHYQAALVANRATDERSDRAVILNNLGLVHENLGHYAKALEKYRAALDVHRELEQRTGVATSLDNIGDVLYTQGRYGDALRHFREALQRYRQEGDSAAVANSLNGIGRIHLGQANLEDAHSKFRSAIRIYRQLNDSSSVAANLHNVGVVHRRQDRFRRARSSFEEALLINRSIEDRASIAKNLAEIGAVHRERGEYENALDRYRESLRMSRELDRPSDIAVAQQGLGLTMLAKREFAGADSLLRGAVQITEALVETASGDNRRDFLAKEMSRFQALVTTRVRAGRLDEAVRAYERSRARLLAERLAGGADSSRTIPPVDSLQSTMDAGEAAVLYANTDTERPILAIIVTRDSTFAEEIPDDSTLDRLRDRFDGALDRLRVREEIRWPGASGSTGLRQSKGLPMGAGAEGTLANLIRLYHYNVSVPSRQQVLSPERTELLGRFLYGLLVGPLENELASVDELIIVPDGALSYLPFGALSDWDGRRLVHRWRVRYVQSLRVLRLLEERSRPSTTSDRRPLLALGGAVYDSASYAADTSRAGAPGRVTDHSNDGRRLGRRGAEDSTRGLASINGKTPGSTYQRLGYGPENWRNLTGTLREVRALAKVADGSNVLVAEQAREAVIQKWSRTGRLDDYRALHFATHGFVVPEEPNLSALVLSEVGLNATRPEARSADVRSPTGGPRTEDGYLSMREIATLDIDAEFVGLSACRTGIGRIYRGSGAVSLAHGFLRAGANSVAVSLWSVYDSSTNRFMEAVYRRAWDRETSWSEAMAETKRAFANGHYGERLTAPRFWAPFVYYGWEAGDQSRRDAGTRPSETAGQQKSR